MDRLKQIEGNVDKVEVFELLEFLKELAVLENDEKTMRESELMVVGLIERVQERIALKWYS